jgi:hypothetical protein
VAELYVPKPGRMTIDFEIAKTMFVKNEHYTGDDG